jgi:hypothetical protein
MSKCFILLPRVGDLKDLKWVLYHSDATGFDMMCGFRSCCWDEGVSGLTDSDKETGFLPNLSAAIQYLCKKPGFWPIRLELTTGVYGF